MWLKIKPSNCAEPAQAWDSCGPRLRRLIRNECDTRKKTGGPLPVRPLECRHSVAGRLVRPRLVGGVEGVLQGHQVFAGLEGIQDGLLGFELLGGVARRLD